MIHTRQPPADGPQAVRRIAAALELDADAGSSKPTPLIAHSGVAFPPMRVFTGDPARPIAWWYPSPLGIAEVADANGAVSFHSGPIVDRIPEALARAEELATGGEYELRVLRRPDRDVVALWLHGSRDMFVSLTPFGAVE
jgi:hypothetical protein